MLTETKRLVASGQWPVASERLAEPRLQGAVFPRDRQGVGSEGLCR
jgi:hypothetical protein